MEEYLTILEADEHQMLEEFDQEWTRKFAAKQTRSFLEDDDEEGMNVRL